MAYGFLDIAATASVKEAQREDGSADYWACFHGERSFDRFTENEATFIAARDSFYMATVSETGWPYVQHRGGPAGFIRMLDDKTLAFADYRGNRQYITVGNAAAGGRAALFLMDYANRRRLKISRTSRSRTWPTIRSSPPRWRRPATRRSRNACSSSHLDAFDWNCPQHITPRFTEAEIDAALAPVRERLAQLEAENKALRESTQQSARDSGGGLVISAKGCPRAKLRPAPRGASGAVKPRGNDHLYAMTIYIWLIAALWLIFIAYWAVMGVRAKRTIGARFWGREAGWRVRAVVLIVCWHCVCRWSAMPYGTRKPMRPLPARCGASSASCSARWASGSPSGRAPISGATGACRWRGGEPARHRRSLRLCAPSDLHRHIHCHARLGDRRKPILADTARAIRDLFVYSARKEEKLMLAQFPTVSAT